MEGDYTYDDQSGQWFTGDPSIDQNWTYEPPGQQGDPNDFNFEPSQDGGWTVHEPGETPPQDAPTFSSRGWYGGPPDQGQQDSAVMDYTGSLAGWGRWGQARPGAEAAPMVDEAEQPGTPEEPEGGVPPDSNGTPAVATPPRGPSPAGPRAPTTNPEIERYLAAYEADSAARARSNKAAFEESQRQANLKEAGATERTNINAGVSREKIAADTLAERLKAQSSDQATSAQREVATGKLALDERQATAAQADAEKKQRLALATALLQLGTGPNGPANRRMALQILAGLGVQGVQGGGQTEAPNLIPPGLWDQIPDGAKKLIMDAWTAQGGDPKDFLQGIDQQRPQGNPTAARPRFAGVAA